MTDVPATRKSSGDSAQALAVLGPIARSSVVEAVADRLRGEILAGRLAPGQRLPSERELSLALGVNRLTLRASLARLEALGLIATRHGAGTVVTSWRERAGLDTLATLISALEPGDATWYELLTATLEMRRILASEAIALAAERRTPADLEAILACKQALLAHVTDPMAYALADIALMRAVCRAAHNVGLELLLNTFARFPEEHPEIIRALYDRGGADFAVYDFIFQIIERRDVEAARTLVRRALDAMDAQWMERNRPPSAPVAAQPAPVTAEPMPATSTRGAPTRASATKTAKKPQKKGSTKR